MMRKFAVAAPVSLKEKNGKTVELLEFPTATALASHIRSAIAQLTINNIDIGSIGQRESRSKKWFTKLSKNHV